MIRRSGFAREDLPEGACGGNASCALQGSDGTLLQQKAVERKKALVIAGCVVVCALLALVSLASGASDMSLLDSARALLGFGSQQDVMTVRSIRLLRVLCAIVSGAGLALAGQNPGHGAMRWGRAVSDAAGASGAV